MDQLIGYLPRLLGSCTGLNLKDADQELIAACIEGESSQKVQVLIRDRNVNIRDSEGKTPLHHASRQGNVELVMLLLEAGADQDLEDHSGSKPLHSADTNTPLCLAASFNQVKTIQWLIEAKASMNKAGWIGTPVYETAGERRSLEALRVLLKARADPDVKGTMFPATPLFNASGDNHVEGVRLLLEARADVELGSRCRTWYHIPFRSGTPLMWAAEKGRSEVIRLLLQAKAIVDRTLGSSTPLFSAAEGGHIETVRLLLSARADVHKTSKHRGATPLFIAAESGHTEVLWLLIRARGHVNNATTDGNGLTPLFSAAAAGHVDGVHMLLDARADANRGTWAGVTALGAGATAGSVEVVKLLIRSRVNVDQADRYGATPLFVAAGLGHLQVIRSLLDARASVNKAAFEGQVTPWMIAEQKGHRQVCDFFIGVHLWKICVCIKIRGPYNHLKYILALWYFMMVKLTERRRTKPEQKSMWRGCRIRKDFETQPWQPHELCQRFFLGKGVELLCRLTAPLLQKGPHFHICTVETGEDDHAKAAAECFFIAKGIEIKAQKNIQEVKQTYDVFVSQTGFFRMFIISSSLIFSPGLRLLFCICWFTEINNAPPENYDDYCSWKIRRTTKMYSLLKKEDFPVSHVSFQG